MGMIRRIKNKKGTALLVWILGAAVLAMALLIIIPVILDVDGSRARQEDLAHEQTAWDSALMQYVAGGNFEAVYDYHNKKFVALTEHPYQVQPYGEMKEHEDCVILVRGEGMDSIKLTWISRKLLKERYR